MTMMNGMNGDGYNFPQPTVTDPLEALNAFGCGIEQVQGALSILAERTQDIADNRELTGARHAEALDIWMLVEATRARLEQLDSLFHAAESVLHKRRAAIDARA
jgi:hypothetical protein